MGLLARVKATVLGPQLRVWLTGVIAFVIAFIIALPVGAGWINWSWPGWTGLGATFGAVAMVAAAIAAVAAVVAIRYARESARASWETLEPMQRMATDLDQAARELRSIDGSLVMSLIRLDGLGKVIAVTAKTMQANLELAEKGRQEDRLAHRLEQYDRVHAALLRMEWVPDTPGRGEEGQAALQAALAPFPVDELPACWALVGRTGQYLAGVTGLSNAITEIEQAMQKAHTELDDLLKSASD
jgi:uncharacterized membrane protein